jgi:hypothetical protein
MFLPFVAIDAIHYSVQQRINSAEDYKMYKGENGMGDGSVDK